MRRRSKNDFRLGSAVVELLIPHRRPFLMVDGVVSYTTTPRPRVEAFRHVSKNEAYFDGHFPGMPLWPGALTMEGLGQTGVVLQRLLGLEREAADRGVERVQLHEALLNLDRGYRLHPGYRPDGVEELVASLKRPVTEMAVGAAVDIKFLKPVLPGCRLDYVAELTDRIGEQMRFAVEASVDDEPVARGSITGAIVPAPPLVI